MRPSKLFVCCKCSGVANLKKKKLTESFLYLMPILYYVQFKKNFFFLIGIQKWFFFLLIFLICTNIYSCLGNLIKRNCIPIHFFYPTAARGILHAFLSLFYTVIFHLAYSTFYQMQPIELVESSTLSFSIQIVSIFNMEMPIVRHRSETYQPFTSKKVTS